MKIQLELPHLVIFESALFRTCTTLIIHDHHAILIDPNWLPIEIEFIDSYIRLKAKNKKLYLFFTHSDYDHIIGYGNFKEMETIASQNFVDQAKKNEIIEQIESFDDQYYIKRDYPIQYPEINIRVKQQKETITLSEIDYQFHQAPGHNSDGLILHDPSAQILVVGDYLSNIEFPYVYHSFMMYRETINRIEDIISKHKIQYLITGHGDATDSTEEIYKRIQESRAYLNMVEESVMQKKTFDFKSFLSNYTFPKIMGQFHEGNMSLARKEFKSEFE